MQVRSEESGYLSDAVPELTAAIAAGDEAAFTRFHQLYWKRVYTYLVALTNGDEGLAADLAQITMIKAARHLGQMTSSDALWAWLSRVARNACIDDRRTRDRRPRLIEWPEKAPAVPELSDSTDTPLFAALQTALADLSTEDRLLIERTYFDKCRQAELADELDLSLKALESRLSRLRQKLRLRVLSALRHD